MSSLEPVDPPPCLDEPSDIFEAEGLAVLTPDVEILRLMGSAIFWARGLPPSDVVRLCRGGGTTNRSAIEEGGDRGREVFMGRLPGDVDNESRCWFLSNVGVKSGPSS